MQLGLPTSRENDGMAVIVNMLRGLRLTRNAPFRLADCRLPTAGPVRTGSGGLRRPGLTPAFRNHLFSSASLISDETGQERSTIRTADHVTRRRARAARQSG